VEYCPALIVWDESFVGAFVVRVSIGSDCSYKFHRNSSFFSGGRERKRAIRCIKRPC
jgi:hypothetical protein